MYLAFTLAERGAFFEKLPRLCATPEDACQVHDIPKSISIGVRQDMWINTITSAVSAALTFVVLKVLGVDFALTLAMAVFSEARLIYRMGNNRFFRVSCPSFAAQPSGSAQGLLSASPRGSRQNP